MPSVARAAREGWSRRADSNRGPADYESAGVAAFLLWKRASGRFVGGFATPVFRRARILWEVISARPRSGVHASRIPVDTYSVPSRHESITSQSAMQACAISLLSRNCPWSSLVVPRCTERSVHEHQNSGILQWAMNRLEPLDHYRRPQNAGIPQDSRRSSFGTLRVNDFFIGRYSA